MDSDKNNPSSSEDNQTSGSSQQAPADALSRTPDDLEQEQAEQIAANNSTGSAQLAEEKVSPLKKFFRKVNVYFLGFILIAAVAGAITIVSYLNSQKPAPEAVIQNQALTEEALKELSNTDASVGDTSQTLTIQGNAIVSGEALMRGNLNVAGSFQTGSSITAPGITISGDSNFGTTQIQSLQVAQDFAVQGSTTMRDLSVSGAATFGGSVTAPQLTVTRLIMSGTAELQIPNHISFTGPSPSRGATGGALGNGGSASVNGSDTTGTVNIRTGSNTAAGCFVRINFNQNFNKQPHVIISPVGSGAGQTQYYVDRDQAGFSICAAAPAPANKTFAYDYFVTN
jgi:hypothetical protein